MKLVDREAEQAFRVQRLNHIIILLFFQLNYSFKNITFQTIHRGKISVCIKQPKFHKSR